MGTRIPLRTTDTQAKDVADKLEMSTAEIGLTVRTTNCLEERGIFTVNDLLHCTREICWAYPTSARRRWKRCTRRWKESVFVARGRGIGRQSAALFSAAALASRRWLKVAGGGSCRRLSCSRDPIGDGSRLLQHP